jgi:hypothetical protein
MREEQDSNVPGSLKSSVYAVFLSGVDIYDMYEALWIPAKYVDAIDEMWESWEAERATNPLPAGTSYVIPSEFPDIN